jgi:hypothetical protein
MNCDWVEKNIQLYIYDELADDARYELEQHVGCCGDCAKELKSARELHSVLSRLPVQEPSPNLLASSRMKLQESLEGTEQSGFWRRLVFDPWAWWREVRFAPAVAAVIFIVGFAGGIGGTYQVMKNHQPIDNNPSTPPVESSVSGIRSITQEPGSNQVRIKYDSVSSQEAQGSLNDQRIQQLLLFAARNNYNSGVRMDSVDLLSHQPQGTRAREALLYALRYDSNPGVRLKALDALGSYVKDDVRVRDGVLEVLLHDSNQGLRTNALHLLGPVRADSSVRAVMQQLADGDHNLYIRSQARTVLAQLPEID